MTNATPRQTGRAVGLRFLRAIVACTCVAGIEGCAHGTVADVWEPATHGVRVRIQKWQTFPSIVPMYSYFSVESAVPGSNRWHELLFWRQDVADTPIPKEHLEIIDDRTSYAFARSKYVVTTNGGETWAEWDALKQSPQSVRGAIAGVQVLRNGTGRMMTVHYSNWGGAPRFLTTTDYGVHWSDDESTHSGDTPEVTAALSSGGLREAARVAGVYRDTIGTFQCCWSTLDYVLKQSARVVVGDVVERRPSRLDAQSSWMNTQFVVRVAESLRGDSHVNDDVTIVVAGGLHRFEDGSTAELVGPASTMSVGDEVVLFLTPFQYDSAFAATGEVGVVQTDSTHHVIIHASLSDGFFREFNGIPLSQFLERVREATQTPQR